MPSNRAWGLLSCRILATGHLILIAKFLYPQEINKEINHLQKFINDRVNIVNVHKGIDAFQFNPIKAKKSLKSRFQYPVH